MAPSLPDPKFEEILGEFRRNPRIAPHIVHWRTAGALAARCEAFPEGLNPRLAAALRKRGIENLYVHQARALQAALAGRDVTVVTPTASGKSLCYQLPVLHSVLEDPRARALLLFPAKALSHDQTQSLRELAAAADPAIQVHPYDGDTPKSTRKSIRNKAQILLSNPDMLHTSILPGHPQWRSFFRNLRWVVVDEIHICRGVFGSHTANVLRRLERICAFHGSRPQYICLSATIANPEELARNLTGREMVLVDENGAPRGPRTMVFFNPPIVDRERGVRLPAETAARRLAMRFIAGGFQTIVFARSRLKVELLAASLRRATKRLRGDPERIRSYRGGYLAAERREIERELREGGVVGVVSTNALELGVDIGGLRAAVLCGYPGSISSAWQQAGRAGRTGEAAAVVLVGSSSPLDQYVLRHPDYFFRTPPESATIHPDNPSILEGHLQCAAYELPLGEDEVFGGGETRRALAALENKGLVRRTGGRIYCARQECPAWSVSLRSASGRSFAVVDCARGNALVAEMDAASAPLLLHEGAVYLHQGQTWIIERTDWEAGIAYARGADMDYYTEAAVENRIEVVSVEQTARLNGGAGSGGADTGGADTGGAPERGFGEASVTSRVTRYRRIRFETQETLGHGEVSAPESAMRTEAVWWRFAPEIEGKMRSVGLSLEAGLRGLAWLVGNLAPVFVLCDRTDFRVTALIDWGLRNGDGGFGGSGGGGAGSGSGIGDRGLERENAGEQRTGPVIYLFDLYPGGIGIARHVFERDAELREAALELLRSCPCAHGCPSCIGPGYGGEAKSSVEYLLRNAEG